jgi:hypothetical protein
MISIKTFIRVQAGKRLVALGGVMPEIREIPRRHRVAVQERSEEGV